MWVFTPVGFFSAVNKPGDSHLTIRARVAADLDGLRAAYLPSLTPTTHSPRADYPYRATATHAAWAEALARMAADVMYGNFKHEVAVRQGRRRADVYGRVWAVLRELESENSAPPSAKTPPPRRKGRGP